VGLNPPLQTQHNEGVEGNSNTAIRRPGADRNEGGLSNNNEQSICYFFKQPTFRTKHNWKEIKHHEIHYL